ncbi:Helix-turn-helix domain-containing protein [Amphibacillus marinus]|uniref:Helix-turn-helix domain-containing protein n=1 Tax=Amphibacillus marinus TaxID=872970 RepID=A0A1H8KJZ2_9BACI|nr:metalloregulator ArsR/SmtB family transcription factor [Amphibacillus marinus]SEN92886.1 Helix-turn-helix domain-containing protein [Amphibacillus marinus]
MKNQIEQDVFAAIADPTRRELLRLLSKEEELPLYRITDHFEIGRTAVSKHLTVLKAANLVYDRKEGRETRYRANTRPLKVVRDWLSYYEVFWNENILQLKKILEEE